MHKLSSPSPVPDPPPPLSLYEARLCTITSSFFTTSLNSSLNSTTALTSRLFSPCRRPLFTSQRVAQSRCPNFSHSSPRSCQAVSLTIQSAAYNPRRGASLSERLPANPCRENVRTPPFSEAKSGSRNFANSRQCRGPRESAFSSLLVTN